MSCQKNEYSSSNYFHFFKKLGFTTDFGKLVQSIPDEFTRFHVRRFNKSLRDNLKILQGLPKPCGMSVSYMRRCLLKILPFQIFGCMYNFSKFMKIIAKLCTATKHENIPMTDITKQWRYSDVKWLQENEQKETVLRNVLIWIIEWIKVNVLKKLFNIQIDTKNNMIIFTEKKFYQILYDRAISDMERKNQLLPCEQDSLDENTRLSRLIIVPKANAFKYRPLVLTHLLRNDKRRIKSIYSSGMKFERNLNKAWNIFVAKNKGKTIYGIKMDLTDAFSNVNMDVIKSLLQKHVRGAEPILRALTNQPILCRSKKVYIWNRGLMQGMAASQRLCDLERAEFDKNNLAPFITKDTFFHRSVDDYFYCSTNKDNVEGFASVLSERCAINESKTERGPKIAYMGRVFNIETLEVHMNVGQIDTYRNKSKLYFTQYNVTDANTYLFNICSMRSNAFHFYRILLNLNSNGYETVLMNYFKAMISVAYKLDYAIQVRWQKAPDILHDFIQGLCKYYMRRARKILKRTKLMKIPLVITRKMLRVVGCRAFILVLRQRNLTYKTTINKLEAYVKSYKRHYIKNIKPRLNQDIPILQKLGMFKLPEDFKNVRVKRIC